MMNVRALKRAAVRMVGPIGGYALLRHATKASPRVFMYHRFSHAPTPRTISKATFREHIRTLARHFRIVTLAELVTEIEQFGATKDNTAVITVDDGYRDFADIAYPVLADAGVPATLFVSTRYTDGDFWLWPDELDYALRNTACRSIVFDSATWEITTEFGRLRCFDSMCAKLTRVSNDDKRRQIDFVLDQLAVCLPDRPTDDYAPVGWSRLREIANSGIEIGGHTQTHPVLSQLPSSQLESEIAGCKAVIEQHLDRQITTFCYPNGQPHDINAEVREAVRSAGFRGAVAAYFRSDVLADRFEIKRYSASESRYQQMNNISGVEMVSSILNQRFGV